MLDALVRTSPTDGNSLRQTLAELRRIKDDWELDQLREAVAASVLAFGDVARELPEAIRGGGERWLQGTFDRRARTAGNGVGYASIVAAGHHAPVLHWVRNDGPVNEGDVILLDAGVETRTLYTADVTRTFPVDGAFTPRQRELYRLVLDAQSAGIAALRPGVEFLSAHRAAMEVIVRGLEAMELLPVPAEEALDPESKIYTRYTLHSTSHMLGLDVHDCASARAESYTKGTVDTGYVLTVEPGLYFQAEDQTVPEDLRGIGIRIEDDILITEDGTENLSGAMPREVEAVEAWMRS
jgi:Xaa-Pro aminopeptidase